MCYCYSYLQGQRKCEVYYREAIRIRPHYVAAWNNLGFVILNMGKLVQHMSSCKFLFALVNRKVVVAKKTKTTRVVLIHHRLYCLGHMMHTFWLSVGTN